MLRLSLILIVVFLISRNDAFRLEPPDEDFTFPRNKEEADTTEETPGTVKPINSPQIDSKELTELVSNLEKNSSHNNSSDLYVIRTVVYEIGILTDAANGTEFDNATHEQIDVSFFDPEKNGSFIDLSNIPVPIQTNISGVSITGLLAANFGDLALLKDGTPTLEGSQFPLLPNKQVTVTHNVSTLDKDNSNRVLSGLPEILGLKDFIKYVDSDSKEEDAIHANDDNSEEVKEDNNKRRKEREERSNENNSNSKDSSGSKES